MVNYDEVTIEKIVERAVTRVLSTATKRWLSPQALITLLTKYKDAAGE